MAARFCSDDCEEAGAICDFCKHYIDNSVLLNLDCFQGDGICDLTKEDVNAIDGDCCDGFVCFRIKDEE